MISSDRSASPSQLVSWASIGGAIAEFLVILGLFFFPTRVSTNASSQEHLAMAVIVLIVPLSVTLAAAIAGLAGRAKYLSIGVAIYCTILSVIEVPHILMFTPPNSSTMLTIIGITWVASILGAIMINLTQNPHSIPLGLPAKISLGSAIAVTGYIIQYLQIHIFFLGDANLYEPARIIGWMVTFGVVSVLSAVSLALFFVGASAPVVRISLAASLAAVVISLAVGAAYALSDTYYWDAASIVGRLGIPAVFSLVGLILLFNPSTTRYLEKRAARRLGRTVTPEVPYQPGITGYVHT